MSTTTEQLPALNPAGRPKEADLAVLPVLSAQQLDAVRALATEGTREHTIRRALALSPAHWKALKADTAEGDLSPLGLALEEGRAAGIDDLVSFFKLRMRDGDVRAAEWLGDKLYKIGREDGNAEQPRVQIILNAPAASVEAFHALRIEG
jgi:hypothetical protein